MLQTLSLFKAALLQQQPLSGGGWGVLCGARSEFAGLIPGQLCIASLAGLALWHSDGIAWHWGVAHSLEYGLQK